MSAERRSPGRPPGARDTRAEILAVARKSFVDKGYRATTYRAIAADVGVDVSTVTHHVGPKHRLFAASLAVAVGPADLLRRALAVPDEQLPSAIAHLVTHVWSDAEMRRPLELLVVQALSDERVGAAVVDHLTHDLLGPLAERIGGRDASARAGAVAAACAGTLLTRHALGARAGSDEDYERALARALSAVLTRP